MNNWIFAHRGQWNSEVSPNSDQSFHLAAKNGFGIETDVRDCAGHVIVSHDPCTNHEHLSLSSLLNNQAQIALNIKTDGIVEEIKKFNHEMLESGSFVFDCSFPQLLAYKKAGIPHAIRISEFEKELPWKPNYIWLDSFESDWWLEDSRILNLIEDVPTIVVSPELHKRKPEVMWEKVISIRESGIDLSICTDHPERVLAYA